MTLILSNNLAKANALSVPTEKKTDAVETPFYKTYPFVLGTGGMLLGALATGFKTLMDPDVYTKVDASGETQDLIVNYAKQGNQPLLSARYDHYIPRTVKVEDSSKEIRQHKNDTMAFEHTGENSYVAHIPYYTPDLKDPTGVGILNYEKAHWSSERNGLVRLRQFPVESPLAGWLEMPIGLNPLDNTKPKGAESTTRLVELQLKKPQKIEGGAFDYLAFFHEGSDSKIAHTILNGRELKVDLNEQGQIHKSNIEALNGLPVLFKEPLPNMQAVLKDVPAYVETLKKDLIQEEKPYGKNIFLGAIVTGVVGYGLGWFLDWKKRHDRQKTSFPMNEKLKSAKK